MNASPYLFPFEPEVDLNSLQRVVDTRSDDGNLHYQFIIPDNWQQLESVSIKAERVTDFVELSRFGLAQNGGPSVSISLARLPREVGASEWLHLAMQSETREILQRRDAYSRRGSIPDVLSKRRTKYGPMIERTVAVKNADCMFRIEFSATPDEYNENATGAFAITHSFEPIADGNQYYAENTESHSLAQSHSVLLPSSWKPVDPKCESLGAAIRSAGGTVQEWESEFNDCWSGTIFAGQAVNIPGASEQLRLGFLESIRERELRFSRAELRDVIVDGSKFQSGLWVEPRLEPSETGHYYSGALILESPAEILILGQLGPAYEAEPHWLAINQRAFEIARDSLTVE